MKLPIPTINKRVAGFALVGFAASRIAWEQDWATFDWGGELVTVAIAGLGVFLLLKG